MRIKFRDEEEIFSISLLIHSQYLCTHYVNGVHIGQFKGLPPTEYIIEIIDISLSAVPKTVKLKGIGVL